MVRPETKIVISRYSCNIGKKKMRTKWVGLAKRMTNINSCRQARLSGGKYSGFCDMEIVHNKLHFDCIIHDKHKYFLNLFKIVTNSIS